MHRTDVPVSLFHYGISPERLFLRIDFRIGYHDPSLIGDAVMIHVAKPKALRIVIPMNSSGRGVSVIDEETGERRELPDGTAAIAEILEVGIPWLDLGATTNDRVQFHLSLEKSGGTLAAWPMTGAFTVSVPDADFERRMWSV
jgi:hypothetical protein